MRNNTSRVLCYASVQRRPGCVCVNTAVEAARGPDAPKPQAPSPKPALRASPGTHILHVCLRREARAGGVGEGCPGELRVLHVEEALAHGLRASLVWLRRLRISGPFPPVVANRLPIALRVRAAQSGTRNGCLTGRVLRAHELRRARGRERADAALDAVLAAGAEGAARARGEDAVLELEGDAAARLGAAVRAVRGGEAGVVVGGAELRERGGGGALCCVVLVTVWGWSLQCEGRRHG